MNIHESENKLFEEGQKKYGGFNKFAHGVVCEKSYAKSENRLYPKRTKRRWGR